MQHRRSRVFWLGMLLSTLGSKMQFWALLWHVRTLTDQPIVLGAIGLTRLVPILALSLLGGILADRHDRRKVLFVT